MTMSGMKSKPKNMGGAMSMDDDYWDMVHNVPEASPDRPGWLRQRGPGDGYISWPATARPSIQANHIDGPMLVMRNGEVQWLTLWERFLFWIGSVDADALEYKYRPYLRRTR